MCFPPASFTLVSSASLPSLRSPRLLSMFELVRAYGLASPVLPDPGFHSIFYVVLVRPPPISTGSPILYLRDLSTFPREPV